MRKTFKVNEGKNVKLPAFFPDATRAVVKTLDSQDIKKTKTPGILVNTYHLYKELGKTTIKKHKDIRNFMSWNGAVISDSGGFQVMSIAKRKKGNGKTTDIGVEFIENRRKILFTPEKSIEFQMLLDPDMVVVLDDFTPPNASFKEAKETVERTILWAKRSKDKFEYICKKRKIQKNKMPYILGVVQGGNYSDLRKKCAVELAKIGFDGFGYGGWPMTPKGGFDIKTARFIADYTPNNYFLYGLGIGKPEDVVACCKLGYNIFDCVLPTRDARHGRLYVYKSESIDNINISKKNFYKFVRCNKGSNITSTKPISTACDCLLCENYSIGYLSHLFKINESSAMRLATIHNLRFYSILMEKIREI